MAKALRASIDGRISAPEEATIGVLDDGLLRGDGVFEAIKLYGPHPFRLTAHLDRLERSAASIHLSVDRSALEAEIDALLESPPAGGDTMLRILATRGGRRILLVEELPEWPASASIALVRLSPSEILAGVKSISYAANMHATRLAAGRGADEAVYVDRDDIVLEAPTSSVFWTGTDGELHTPSLATGILDSITRDVVIAGVPCREGAYPAADLRGAQAAFLASTTREIQPISSVDGEALAEPDGGEQARRAEAALSEAVADERGAANGQ
ncbi:MAG TPA: aminotransferase class IV [Solirubrobacterales bacterium]|nr:aminotransferase class IV [Solirubrobacterales bacterium]